MLSEDAFPVPDSANEDAAAQGNVETSRGRCRGRGRGGRGGRGRDASAAPKAKGGKKIQPVTTCIVPGCQCPKYPGSRFCSVNPHTKVFNNVMYQRRTRKDLSNEDKEAFDRSMKDNGLAGKTVGQFALDNPLELCKKGLVMAG